MAPAKHRCSGVSGRSLRRRAAWGAVLAGLALCRPVPPIVAAQEGEAAWCAPCCALLRELRQRHLAPENDGEFSRLALEALLNAFGTGGRLGDAAQSPALELVAQATTANTRYIYFRIAAVEDGLPQAVATAHADVGGGADGGVVLDLRACGGNGMRAAAETATLVAGWERPVVVLMNRGTRAAAEVLAASLHDAHGAVLVGEPSRGLPYAMVNVPLTGTLQVLLPDVPAGAVPRPLQPDVPFDAAVEHRPGGQAVGGAAEAGDIGGDECVRQALDLLAAIAAFGEKRF